MQASQIQSGVRYAIRVSQHSLLPGVVEDIEAAGLVKVRITRMGGDEAICTMSTRAVVRLWSEQEAMFAAKALERRQRQADRASEQADTATRLAAVIWQLERSGAAKVVGELTKNLSARTMAAYGHRVSLEAIEELAALLRAYEEEHGVHPERPG